MRRTSCSPIAVLSCRVSAEQVRASPRVDLDSLGQRLSYKPKPSSFGGQFELEISAGLATMMTKVTEGAVHDVDPRVPYP